MVSRSTPPPRLNILIEESGLLKRIDAIAFLAMVYARPIPALGDNYIWVLGADEQRHVAIVDPGDAQPVERWLASSGATPEAILLTHHHGDHVGGATELASRYGLPVYGPADERIGVVTHPLRGGQAIELDAGVYEVLSCPGHTRGHIAYLGAGCLLSGDALFAGGCGRVFEGSPEQMHATLQRLASLPEDTQICCGHEYTLKNLEFAHHVEPDNTNLATRLESARHLRAEGQPTVPSTIADELATNPFLRVGLPEVRTAAEHWAGRPLDGDEAVFAALRRWKDLGG